MKKKSKKLNSQPQTFKSGEVISILENMNDGIKIIGEQHKDLRNDIKIITKQQQDLKDDMNIVKADVSIIKSDIAEIKFELKRKVYYDEFEKLEKRVVKLEKLGFAR